MYRELQWTATAAPSICEFEHGHYMGYAIMEDGLQEANQSEEPWNLKVGPDCTPHQPSCSDALCAPGCADLRQRQPTRLPNMALHQEHT